MLCARYFNLTSRSLKFYSNHNLVSIGELQEVKDIAYNPCQLFLHKIFGYRGIVIRENDVQLYDRNLARTAYDFEYSFLPEQQLQLMPGQQTKYYQVLVDLRDLTHVRILSEAVTFIDPDDDDERLFCIPGVDYVPHECILPYSSNDRYPIKNDLFDHFFFYNPNSDGSLFSCHERILKMMNSNHSWLELKTVHRETTNNVTVSVLPFYIGRKKVNDQNCYWWRYCIRIENHANDTMTLQKRHLRIFSQSGVIENIKGEGVLGTTPVFSSYEPVFQYCSHISLRSPTGYMWGSYTMVKQNGEELQVHIPPFMLQAVDSDVK